MVAERRRRRRQRRDEGRGVSGLIVADIAQQTFHQAQDLLLGRPLALDRLLQLADALLGRILWHPPPRRHLVNDLRQHRSQTRKEILTAQTCLFDKIVDDV